MKGSRPKSDSSGATKLWPRLGFSLVGELDYLVEQYNAEWFQVMRGVVTELHESGQWVGPRAWPIIQLLHRLEENGEAITKLNHHRPTVPRKILGLNRAVHFFVRARLRPQETKRVTDEVAEVWGRLSSSRLKEDIREFGRDARATVRSVLKLLAGRSPKKSRRATAQATRSWLEKFDQDMVDRATLLVGRESRPRRKHL